MKAAISIPLSFVFLSLGSAASLAAGYDFSISASPTDPSVNTSGSTGEVRNVYLWLTCTEDGISAFEGDVTGTLPVLSFVSRNGVMNAGDPSRLLLAVPGCPQGPDVNLLLGYWIVQDTGGTLCLGPSADHGRLGAVDCQAIPNLTADPKVTGFSSTGGAPGSVGVNSCAQQASVGLVVGYGTEIPPPYEFTGVGTEILYLNGLQYFPSRRDPSREVVVSPEIAAFAATGKELRARADSAAAGLPILERA